MSKNKKKSLLNELGITNVILVLLLISSASYLYKNTNSVASKSIEKPKSPKVEICYFFEKELPNQKENETIDTFVMVLKD